MCANKAQYRYHSSSYCLLEGEKRDLTELEMVRLAVKEALKGLAIHYFLDKEKRGHVPTSIRVEVDKERWDISVVLYVEMEEYTSHG